MKKLTLVCLFLIAGVQLVDSRGAEAQVRCSAATYEPSDIEFVRLAVSDASVVLSRMIVLATQSLPDTLSCTQRSALNYEYMALLGYFDELWNRQSSQRISLDTRRYLKNLLNSKTLNFQGSTILAANYSTPEECEQFSQGTASTALMIVTGAMANLAYCAVSLPRAQYRPGIR